MTQQLLDFTRQALVAASGRDPRSQRHVTLTQHRCGRPHAGIKWAIAGPLQEARAVRHVLVPDEPPSAPTDQAPGLQAPGLPRRRGQA